MPKKSASDKRNNVNRFILTAIILTIAGCTALALQNQSACIVLFTFAFICIVGAGMEWFGL